MAVTSTIPHVPHATFASVRAFIRDARLWQILALSSLLTFGMNRLGFDQTLSNVVMILAVALATQAAFDHFWRGAAFEPRSALISALSLCLLLRAGEPWILALAAFIAIASKFLIRANGKHIFNPTNGAIAILLLTTDQVWISPSQWGSATWLAFFFVSLAILVLSRAKRADIALAFLGTIAAILLMRAIWLGDPWSIPLKQMQSGALLLFAFFMISDPKTTPDTRMGRILFAVLVATVGCTLQLACYMPEGMMYALFFASPLVPLIDRELAIARADRFQWSRPTV